MFRHILLEELLTDTEAIFGVVSAQWPVAYGYFRYSKAIIPPIFCNDIFGSNMRSITATLPYKTGEVTTEILWRSHRFSTRYRLLLLCSRFK